MPVVINDFEVVPQMPVDEIKSPGKESGEKSAPQPPTDYEVEKMLERCAERLERVSAN